MEFNSQIHTNREQSERLLALGLKKETADICLHGNVDISFTQPFSDLAKIVSYPIIPAWSLHRLIEMMPHVITQDNYDLILGVNATCVYYADNEYGEVFKDFEGNLYECVVKCIEWLIKEGYFNKEYLEGPPNILY